MALVFFLTFTVGDFLKGYFETGLEWLSGAVLAAMQHVQASDWLISLVVDGIVAGVGGILTFLPNIFILFLALAFLEDSGYMARVAYVMNEIMGRVGLSGKAFLPMLLGFGCTVPAVMASRALATERDRRRTILITPFMSCSARLPIYVLFSEMFFKEHAMLAAYSLYVIGLIVAITIAFILHKREKNKDEDTLLIELPEYKTPNARTVAIYVWDKVKDYLTKAGTTIFVASIVLWFVLNFGVHGYETDVTQSFAAAIGRILVPVLRPARSWYLADRGGFDFRFVRKRGGGIQLFRALRHQQHQLCGGHGRAFQGSGDCRVWHGKCLCAVSILSFVFSVRGCSGNHPARNKVIKIHDANGSVSDCSCLVFCSTDLSDWKQNFLGKCRRAHQFRCVGYDF